MDRLHSEYLARCHSPGPPVTVIHKRRSPDRTLSSPSDSTAGGEQAGRVRVSEQPEAEARPAASAGAGAEGRDGDQEASGGGSRGASSSVPANGFPGLDDAPERLGAELGRDIEEGMQRLKQFRQDQLQEAEVCGVERTELLRLWPCSSLSSF